MEILVILLIALLLLGPEKMPEVVKTLARVMREIRRVGDEVRMHLDPDLDSFKISYPDIISPERHDAKADGSPVRDQSSDQPASPNPSPDAASQIGQAPGPENTPAADQTNPTLRRDETAPQNKTRAG